MLPRYYILYYSILDKQNYYRVFDYKKFLLYINDEFYVPTTKYNNYFRDMGNLYGEKEINGKTFLKFDKNAVSPITVHISLI